MRFMLLTPGTGHFYCGSCLRDNTLGNALREIGHEVDMVPLYLPHVLEGSTSAGPVQMGGINMYLQQKSRLAGKLPRFVTRLLDRPGLLRWVSRRRSLTDAKLLGAMTLSMLSGESGHQRVELDKLVAWANSVSPGPDVIVLSNMLLSGIARGLGDALQVPVISTMQGESPFLDALPTPFSEQAWAELRRRVVDIDAFVAVSSWYGDLMQKQLAVPSEKMHVIYNGLDPADFTATPPLLAQRQPATIGYLARLCSDKGVDLLVDAFIRLKARDTVPGLRLCLAGVQLAEDIALMNELRARLQEQGVADDVEVHANVSREEKLTLLHKFSVLSVPATYAESFGLYLLEAMGAGVPVVQPDHAAFPEILEATGGGDLCAPNDASALAESLERLLLDGERAQRLADVGRQAVLVRFPAERMAREFADVGIMLTRSQRS
ncbi:MAG: glycosyltransferase family 4 protein [Planctomycetota bacterium]|nr:glycosyltransferase family 4 protein [Planctomycetota bacterium]